MISYIIQVHICWLIFLGFYQLFFKGETFFSLNRIYLLSSLILSFLIPLISFSVNKEFLATTAFNLDQVIIGAQSLSYMMDGVVITDTIRPEWSWLNILLMIYLAGVVISAGRMIYGMFQIYTLRAEGTIEHHKGYSIVQSEKVDQPFSFFHQIFVHPCDLENQSMASCVVAHEVVHVKEKHSYDIILVELLSCLVWFSPLIYMYKRFIRTTHEFSADASVLKFNTKALYASALLNQVHKPHSAILANNFAQTQLQKRIKMMKKSSSNSMAKAKYFLAVPALVLAMCFASNLKLEAQEVKAKNFKHVALKESIEGDVYKKVDQMPLFKGCEKELNPELRQKCSNAKLIEHLVANMEYPEDSKKKGVEGMVVVQFVINDDGKVNSSEVMRSVDPSCDAEALRVVSSLPDWIPGMNKGEPVNVLFTLPIRFTLTDEERENSSKKMKYEDKSNPQNDGAKVIKTTRDISLTTVEAPKSYAYQGTDPVYKNVESMPRFPGCEDLTDSAERGACAQQKMLEYVYKNIKYPDAARTAGIEGMVVVQFLVNSDGKTDHLTILRSMGEDLDQSVKNMFAKMSSEITWVPGKQDGKNVNVQFTLPVRFKLSPKEKKLKVGK